VTNAYDGFGRLASSSTNMGGTTRTLTYQYDADGNRIRITHPDANYFSEDYDGLDRAIRIRENTATSTDPTTYLATIYYNPDGTPESLLRGSTSPAAYAYTTYAHDTLGRLTDLTPAPTRDQPPGLCGWPSRSSIVAFIAGSLRMVAATSSARAIARSRLPPASLARSSSLQPRLASSSNRAG
jgi:YD repeat-containing protein